MEGAKQGQEEEEDSEVLLHCLREFADRVEDGRALAAAASEEDGVGLEDEATTRALMVARPRPNVPMLMMALVESVTGIMTRLKLNWNRDASPIEMTLLRARKRPRWALFTSSNATIAAIIQERSLVLRYAPDFNASNQRSLLLPNHHPENCLPPNWRACFSYKGDFILVANWSQYIYCYPTQFDQDNPPEPACTIDTSGDGSALKGWQKGPNPAALIAGMACRKVKSNTFEALVATHTGTFTRVRLTPTTQEDKSGTPTLSSSMDFTLDLKRWHRVVAGMGYSPSQDTVVFVGGSTPKGLASVVTVWKVENEGMSILHEVSVGVGPPVLMTDTDGQKAKANLNRFWLAVDLVLSWLEAKAPIQCPVVSLVASPEGGYVAMLDLEGGLTLFASKDDTFVPLGDRITSLSVNLTKHQGDEGATKNIMVAELAWWSEQALAVLDRRGLVYVLQVIPSSDGRTLSLKQILATETPLGKGATFSCPGDNQQLLLLQSYVSLHGRLQGQLTQIRRQSPMEAMLSSAQAGKMNEALGIASRFGLETDEMFKSLWLKANEEKGATATSAVQDILVHVKDIKWVLNQVMTAGQDAETIRALCNLGFRRTDLPEVRDAITSNPMAPVDLTPAQIETVKNRLEILELASRLELFQVIYGPESSKWGGTMNDGGEGYDSTVPFDVKGFTAFRTRSLVEVGEELASEANLRALTLLLNKHPVGSGPRRGRILRRLPETLPPSTYQHLLPLLSSLDARTPRGGGGADWAHSDQVREKVGGGVGGLGEKKERWDRSSLVQWYITRVRELEGLGAPLSFALELCDIGIARTFPEPTATPATPLDPGLTELANLHRDLWHLSRLVYAGLLPDCFTLKEWSSLPLPSMIKTILKVASLSTLVEDTNAHVIPLLRGQLAVCDEEEGESLLEEEITSYLTETLQRAKAAEAKNQDEGKGLAEEVLEACGAIAEASKPTIVKKDRLIRHETALMRCVLNWCYAYDKVSDDISRLWDMFECLPMRLEELEAHHEDMKSLQNQVDELEAVLTVADTLLKYGITTVPLTMFRDLGKQPTPPHPSGKPWTFREVMALDPGDTLSVGPQAQGEEVPLVIKVIKILADRLGTVRAETKASLRTPTYWEEFGADVRAIQQRLFRDTPPQLWYSTALYACLRSGVLELNTEVVTTVMKALQVPATITEDIIVQSARDNLLAAESGSSTEVERARAALAALPFSSGEVLRQRGVLEAIKMAAKLAGPTDDPDLVPREIARMEGSDRISVIEAVLEANPKAYTAQHQMTRTAHGIEEKESTNYPGSALVELGKLLGMKRPVDKSKILLLAAQAAEGQGDITTAITLLSTLIADLTKRRTTEAAEEELEFKLVEQGVFELTREMVYDPKSGTAEARKRLTLLATFTCPERFLADFIHVLAGLELQAAMENPRLTETDRRLWALGEEMRQRQAQQFLASPELEDAGVVGGKANKASLQREWDEVLCQLASESFTRARAALMPRKPSGVSAGHFEDYLNCPEAHLSLAGGFLLAVSDISLAIKAWASAIQETEDRMDEEAEELLRIKEDLARVEAGEVARGRAVAPDESLVKQLQKQGFSRNGAMRAAIAVGNDSLDKALHWAISHSGDRDFDLPPVLATSAAQLDKEIERDKVMVEQGVETRHMAQLTQAAKHFFCLEAVLGQTVQSDPEVMKLPAQELVNRVQRSAPSDPEDQSRSALALREALRYCREAGGGEIIANIKEFAPSLDTNKFRQDAAYREVICRQVVQHEDGRCLQAVIQASANFGLDRWEMSMAHVDWHLSTNLPSVYTRGSTALVNDKLTTLESMLFSGASKGVSGEAQDEAVAAQEPSGSQASELLLELSSRPDELFMRWKYHWEHTDGKYLALLDLICRLATDTLNRDPSRLIPARLGVPPASTEPTVRAYLKRLKEHSVLIRRLVRISGLVVDYKALMGPSLLGDEEGQAVAKAIKDSQAQSAYAEIRRVVERDNLGTLVKLAARIPGITVSLMYKAYTEKVLMGYDALLSEEEARLDSDEARMAHRLFVAEPYMEKVGAAALVGLVESICGKSEAGWSRVAHRISLVEKAMQVVKQTDGRGGGGPQSLRKASFEDQGEPPRERLIRLSKMLKVLEKLESLGVEAEVVDEVQGLWSRWERKGVGEVFVRLIKMGKLLNPADVQDLITAYVDSLDSGRYSGQDEDLLGPLYVAAVREELQDLQAPSTTHQALSSLRQTLASIANDDRLWSLVAPVVQGFINVEEGEEVEGSSLHHARGDVVVLLSELHRPLASAGAGSSEDLTSLLAYNRAAEILSLHFQAKAHRKQLSAWEGRGEVFVSLLPRAQTDPGKLRALVALLKIWTGQPAGTPSEVSEQVLVPLYSHWAKAVLRRVQDPEAVDDQQPPPVVSLSSWEEGITPVAETEGRCWRGLVEAALKGGHFGLVSELLLAGSWRYSDPPLLNQATEIAIIENLESGGAPLQLRLKVMLSSPHEPVQRAGVSQLLAAFSSDSTTATADAGILIDADDALLGLIVTVLHLQLPSLAKTPLYRSLVTAMLARDRSPPSPSPLPSNLVLLVSILVCRAMHLYAASLVAEALEVHPALRTVDGCLSLLWSYISRAGQGGAKQQEGEGETPVALGQGWEVWKDIRTLVLARLEADDEV